MPTIVTIKNLKYSEFMSQETHCFEGTVYVDGERFCYARNDGHGGCDSYDPINRTDNLWESIEALNKKLRAERADEFKTHKRGDGSTFEIGPDFECLVCDAVTDALYLRDAKRCMGRKWLWLKPDGKVYECNRQKGQDPKVMQELLDKREPGSKLFHLMEDADIVAAWKSLEAA